ncbi:MAG: hypothetical protein ACKO34_00460 [Vampirovibrionales bacterium]
MMHNTPYSSHNHTASVKVVALNLAPYLWYRSLMYHGGMLLVALLAFLSVQQVWATTQPIPQLDWQSKQGTLRLYIHSNDVIDHHVVRVTPELVVLDLENIERQTASIHNNFVQAPNVEGVTLKWLEGNRLRIEVRGQQLNEPIVGFRSNEPIAQEVVARPSGETALVAVNTPKTNIAPVATKSPASTVSAPAPLATPKAIHTAPVSKASTTAIASTTPTTPTASTAIAMTSLTPSTVAPSPVATASAGASIDTLIQQGFVWMSNHTQVLGLGILAIAGKLFTLIGLMMWRRRKQQQKAAPTASSTASNLKQRLASAELPTVGRTSAPAIPAQPEARTALINPTLARIRQHMQQQGHELAPAEALVQTASPYQSNPVVAANIAAKRYQQASATRGTQRGGQPAKVGHQGQQVLDNLSAHLTPEARANIQRALGQ